MPDLLTHVLIAYALGTALSLQYDWLTPEYVTVVMLGSVVPDLTKIYLVVPSYRIEAWLGIPFDWFAIHTVGGVLVATAVGALCTTRDHRRRVFGLLLVGALLHLVLDALLIKVSGHMEPMLWPLTSYRPPTPGLYLSSDRWTIAVAGAFAVLARYARARR